MRWGLRCVPSSESSAELAFSESRRYLQHLLLELIALGQVERIMMNLMLDTSSL